MDSNERRRLTRRARRGDLGAAMQLAAVGKPALADAMLRRLADAGAEGMWRVLGNLHADLGDHVQAIAAYREAIRREPQWLDAYVDLAITLKQVGDVDEAEALCRTAIAGGLVSANYTLGRILVQRERFDEAEVAYALAADDGDPYAMFNLGNLCATQGRSLEAAVWFERAAAAGDEATV